jgi:hypothetical protein
MSYLNPIDGSLLLPECFNDAYICPVCLTVGWEMSTACSEGHPLCGACMRRTIATTGMCAICKAPTDLSKVQRNRPFDDIISKLQMRCMHSEAADNSVSGDGGSAVASGSKRKAPPVGCMWTGPVGDFDRHLSQYCDHHLLPCRNARHGCAMTMLRADLAPHEMSSNCCARPTKCKHCALFCPKNGMSDHLLTCPSSPAKCRYAVLGCKVKNQTFATIDTHYAECAFHKIKCTALGCTFVCMRSEMADHEKETSHHKVLTDNIIKKLQSRIVDLEDQYDRLQRRSDAIQYTFRVECYNDSTFDQPWTSDSYKFGQGPVGCVDSYYKATPCTPGLEYPPSIHVDFYITRELREWRIHVHSRPTHKTR